MFHKKRTPQQKPDESAATPLGAESTIPIQTVTELAASRHDTTDGKPSHQEQQRSGIRGKPHYR